MRIHAIAGRTSIIVAVAVAALVLWAVAHRPATPSMGSPPFPAVRPNEVRGMPVREFVERDRRWDVRNPPDAVDPAP